MATLEERLYTQVESVGTFRDRFPKHVAAIEAAHAAATQFKVMLIGADTPEAPWTHEDQAIAGFLDRALLDLEDAIQELFLGRLKPAMVILRGVVEQFFFALYYKDQAIDFALWQRDSDHFVMLHQLYDTKHCFRKYYAGIFRERKDPEWCQTKNDKRFSNKIFDDLEDLYSALCAPVHGRPDQREKVAGTLDESEVQLFTERLHAAIAITAEFFDAAGTGEPNDVLSQFHLTKEMKVR